MELELKRHRWSSLDSPYDDSGVLPDAIRQLCAASDRQAAELAVTRISRVLPTHEVLSQASVATASALVSGLWRCDDTVVDLVLGLLADMAAGFEEEESGDGEYSAVHLECLKEISLGFIAYVEILETSSNVDARTACIDLITACGLATEWLTRRAAFFLESASRLPDMRDFADVIENSLSDLRERIREGGPDLS
ncbi:MULTISPECIES: hypothetical protein [Micromonospora]|nr:MULTISPECIES: hypothetical protein [Micromonospora]